jgi:repressor LexA
MAAQLPEPPTPRFTKAQGQYLAFIYYYTKIHRRPPAEMDMAIYFRAEPSIVHNMVKALHARGLIERTPGEARTIRVLMDRAELPDLE